MNGVKGVHRFMQSIRRWGSLAACLALLWISLWIALPARTAASADFAHRPPPPSEAKLVPPVYNQYVAAIITAVQSSQLYSLDGRLSGEWPVTVGGSSYTITTRNTGSGVPIQKATQYVYEYLQSLGLYVEYDPWTACGRSNRNVVGILTGTLRPQEQVLVTAHLDDMPSSGIAPGADDNASGSAGVLAIAEIARRYRFERTVRFILFTGEEQGLCGSEAYAIEAFGRSDTIYGVLNMDMVAFNSDSLPAADLYANTRGPGSETIAQLYADVVSLYALPISPTVFVNASLGEYSDNASFWDQGYPAVLLIEDDDDFSDFYHQPTDKLRTLNMEFYTAMVRGAAGTMAYMARVQRPLPGLIITKTTAVPAVMSGGLLTYTIRVKNSGTTTATGVVISDTLPAGTTPAWIDGGALVGDSVIWNSGELAADAELTRTLVVTVPVVSVDGSVVNQAYQVSAAELPTPVSGSPVTVALQAIAPALTISKTAELSTVIVGNRLTYTIRVENNGVVPATKVVISDTLPVSTALADAGGGALDGETIVWNEMELGIGSVLTRTLVVTVSGIPAGMSIVVNQNYGASADGVMEPAWGEPVTVAAFMEEIHSLYLPVILRGIP